VDKRLDTHRQWSDWCRENLAEARKEIARLHNAIQNMEVQWKTHQHMYHQRLHEDKDDPEVQAVHTQSHTLAQEHHTQTLYDLQKQVEEQARVMSDVRERWTSIQDQLQAELAAYEHEWREHPMEWPRVDQQPIREAYMRQLQHMQDASHEWEASAVPAVASPFEQAFVAPQERKGTEPFATEEEDEKHMESAAAPRNPVSIGPRAYESNAPSDATQRKRHTSSGITLELSTPGGVVEDTRSERAPARALDTPKKKKPRKGAPGVGVDLSVDPLGKAGKHKKLDSGDLDIVDWDVLHPLTKPTPKWVDLPRNQDNEIVFHRPIALPVAHRNELRSHPKGLFANLYRFVTALQPPTTKSKQPGSLRVRSQPKDAQVWRMDPDDPLLQPRMHLAPRTFEDDTMQYVTSTVWAALTGAKAEVQMALEVVRNPVAKCITLYDLICSKTLSPWFQELVQEHLTPPRKHVSTRVGANLTVLERQLLLRQFQIHCFCRPRPNAPLEVA
jgi:hypothetical protein